MNNLPIDRRARKSFSHPLPTELLFKFLSAKEDLSKAKGLEFLKMESISMEDWLSTLKAVLLAIKSIIHAEGAIPVLSKRNPERLIGETLTDSSTKERAVLGTVESKEKKFPTGRIVSNDACSFLDFLLTFIIMVERDFRSSLSPQDWKLFQSLKTIPGQENILDHLESLRVEYSKTQYILRSLIRENKGLKLFLKKRISLLSDELLFDKNPRILKLLAELDPALARLAEPKYLDRLKSKDSKTTSRKYKSRRRGKKSTGETQQ
jgi:hypothetical protein